MILNHVISLVFIVSFLFVTDTAAREAIIGGNKAGSQQSSYHVAVIAHSNPYCSGAIISSELILTAARCVVSDGGDIQKRRLFILGGTTDLRQVTPPAVLREVKKVYVLRDYVPFLLTPIADIAALKLIEPLDLAGSHNLKALALPTQSHENFDGMHVQVSGYGWSWIIGHTGSHNGGRNDTELQYSDAVVLRPGQPGCPTERIHPKQICARVWHHDDQQHGVCTGDLGAPLVLHGNLLIGILSVIPPGCSERDYAAIYTRTSTFMNFIRNVKHDRVTKYMDALELVQ